MREFVVYTGLRLLLFVGTLGLVIGIWMAIADSADVFIAVIIAFVVSGVASYFILERHRAAFAARVEERASRATANFEEMRAKEDRD